MAPHCTIQEYDTRALSPFRKLFFFFPPLGFDKLDTWFPTSCFAGHINAQDGSASHQVSIFRATRGMSTAIRLDEAAPETQSKATVRVRVGQDTVQTFCEWQPGPPLRDAYLGSNYTHRHWENQWLPQQTPAWMLILTSSVEVGHVEKTMTLQNKQNPSQIQWGLEIRAEFVRWPHLWLESLAYEILPPLKWMQKTKILYFEFKRYNNERTFFHK